MRKFLLNFGLDKSQIEKFFGGEIFKNQKWKLSRLWVEFQENFKEISEKFENILKVLREIWKKISRVSNYSILQEIC